MFSYRSFSTLLLLFACSTSGADEYGFPVMDVSQSFATAAPIRIEVAPDGSGPSLAELGMAITVTVIGRGQTNEPYAPIEGFAHQDIYVWNLPGESSFNMCLGGAFAAVDTDANGVTTIDGPFFAGGSANGTVQVYVMGDPVDPAVSPPLEFMIVSADLDADLDVDLDDLMAVPGGFANLFLNGSYDWQVDFNADEAENILDLVRFAELFLGQATCP